MLDFGGPNIAKPMHVGHLRASIIGDSLQRLYPVLRRQGRSATFIWATGACPWAC